MTEESSKDEASYMSKFVDHAMSFPESWLATEVSITCHRHILGIDNVPPVLQYMRVCGLGKRRAKDHM